MPRPIKWRRVEFIPKSTYFVPIDKPRCETKETVLKIEELEAMRLKDVEGLNQEECAKKMNVSRQTFQNIIDSARKKIATALIEGNAISIRGGKYTRNLCEFKCFYCQNVYEVQYEEDRYVCPKCGATEVVCKKKNNFCHKGCKKNF